MTNRLSKETSPYLLQHAHNPVDWFPWGDEAFEIANAQHKPVLVSIGYSACHWCHVMERESFENDEVASYMNEHFINIKVDREEHPDVDHFYMDALQATSGSGGWPLNMFVTAERKPFYGGTYFPPQRMYNRASWLEVLEAIHLSWVNKQDEIESQSAQLIQHLQQASIVTGDKDRQLGGDMPAAIAEQLLRQADNNYGGFGAAPKFPSTMAIIYLLQHYHFYKNEDALNHALFSLNKMIDGGINDQIGGGFSRYATDNDWLVPHFEKMLYDNALLVSAMSHAFGITKDEKYKLAIEQTIVFCNRELKDEVGFYSALDADSEGIEGKYYTWTWREWQQVLPDAHPAIADYFGVTESGNWEGVNILNVATPESYILDKYKLDKAAWDEMLNDAKAKLFDERAERMRPGTDDKMLLSWNALMNIALIDAGVALGCKEYIEQARQHMDWMLDVFYKENNLLHTAKGNHAKIKGKLDDYAYTVKALIQLASASGDLHFLSVAKELMDYTIDHFSDEDNRFFYFTSNQQIDIPVRKIESYDGATPSANSVMLENLLTLGNVYETSHFITRAETMLRDMAMSVVRYPLSFALWAITLQQYINGQKELIIAGPDAFELLSKWQGYYQPAVKVFATRTDAAGYPAFAHKFKEGYTHLYLCEQFSCRAPFSDIDTMMREVFFRV